MITENQYIQLIKYLQRLEEHIVNLIIPINSITNDADLKELTQLLKKPIQINNLELIHELKCYINSLNNDLKNPIFKDISQALNEIAYTNNRLLKIEEALVRLEKSGLKNNHTIEVFIDGKPTNEEAVKSQNIDVNTNKILDFLNAIDKSIILQHHGLLGYKPQPLSALATKFELSKETIRRRYYRAIKTLRKLKKTEFKNIQLESSIDQLL
jgi:DNA-directed RNA polymerase sigma subunit (sigma70/sigma32)